MGTTVGPSLPAVSSGIGMGIGIGRPPVPEGITIGLSDSLGASKNGGDDEGTTDGWSGILAGSDDTTSGASFAGRDCVELDTVKERVSLVHRPFQSQRLIYPHIPGPSLFLQFPRRCHCNDRLGSAASDCATRTPDMKRANDRRIMER